MDLQTLMSAAAQQGYTLNPLPGIGLPLGRPGLYNTNPPSQGTVPVDTAKELADLRDRVAKLEQLQAPIAAPVLGGYMGQLQQAAMSALTDAQLSTFGKMGMAALTKTGTQEGVFKMFGDAFISFLSTPVGKEWLSLGANEFISAIEKAQG